MDSLNLTRVAEMTVVSNPINIMANKTFVVTLIQNPPYTMLKEETKKLEGNDRFEGFAIDLFTEIAKILHFNITFKLVDDGKVFLGEELHSLAKNGKFEQTFNSCV